MSAGTENPRFLDSKARRIAALDTGMTECWSTRFSLDEATESGLAGEQTRMRNMLSPVIARVKEKTGYTYTLAQFRHATTNAVYMVSNVTRNA